MLKKLVIFDCDGVLVDSELIANRGMAELLTAWGYPVTAQDCIDRFVGMSLSAVKGLVESDGGLTMPDDFAEQIRARDLIAFGQELEAVAGVDDALKAIPLRRCVASSGMPEKILNSLTITGLLKHFEPHLFSASMVAHGKPAPDLFLHAAERMGVAPKDVVVIEDSLPGIQAALAAGMTVLGFCGASHTGPGHGDMLLAAGADGVFDAMAELPGLLGV